MRLQRSAVSRIRLRAGFSSAGKAAAAVGCSRVHMHNIERGASRPSFELKARMAETYAVSMDELSKALAAVRKELLRRLVEAG